MKYLQDVLPLDELQNSRARLKARLIVYGLVVGFISGLFAVAYRFALSNIDNFRDALFTQKEGKSILLLLGIMAISSLILSLFLKWAPYSGGSGIPQIHAELLDRISMDSVPTLVSKFFGGCLSALGGLALGREGPSIQLGGISAKLLSEIKGSTILEKRYLISAGASAGLAAAFNAPIAGVLFSLEEMYKSFSHYLLIPCILSSVTANFISFQLLGMEPAFSFPMLRMLPTRYIWIVILLGIAGGVVGTIFNAGLLKTQKFMNELPLPKYAIIFIAFLMALAIGLWNPELLGGGHHLVEDLAMNGFPVKSILIFFLIRMVFVWVSYGTGAQGGIFLPVLVLGALVGSLFHIGFSNVLHGEFYPNFLYLGMAAVLTSVVQAPLLSILLISEMSGTMMQMMSVTAVAFVSYLVSQALGSHPIYESLYDNLVSGLEEEEEEENSEESSLSIQHFLVPGDASYIGKPLGKLNWKKSPLILSIVREGEEFIPNGKTKLLGGDDLLVVLETEDMEDLTAWFEGNL